MPGNTPLVSLKKAAKFYGPKLVFKDVSLEVLAGEVWLVVGANGAGKSTMLSVLSGLARPSAGEAELHVGNEKVGYLGHETFLYPGLTALENLEFWTGLYGRKADRQSLLAALERVGLVRAADERAGRFSRGMAQRLSLARVLLQEPELLFLDEPGTGLDARSLAMLHEEIEAARSRGTAIVWVSHTVLNDLSRADKVVFLENNRAAYVGPAADFVPGGCIC